MVENPLVLISIAVGCFVAVAAALLTGRMLNIVISPGVIIAERQREPLSYWMSVALTAFAAVIATYQAITAH